ncbi:MAG: nitroreductase family protein [Roseovarius sp.]|nr:nitroreductase family protein [Roseovarius sp.]
MTKPISYRPIPLPDRQDMSDSRAISLTSDFLAFMKCRHSVRDFSSRAIPEEVISNCIAIAGTAPSGANQQPWHFAAISDANLKARIRGAAEKEEERFYDGGAGDEWLAALEPIGTGVSKPHLTDAPWLIVVFAQRYGANPDGSRRKHYYVPESVGLATGMLITALHKAGLCSLTHTPNPMRFLNGLLNRPENEKPVMILAVGHAAREATVPMAAKIKKPLDQIMTIHRSETGNGAGK